MLTITGTPLTSAIAGQSYSWSGTISGGTPPYTAAGFKGSNPGLTITVNGAIVTISGAVAKDGQYANLIAQIRDKTGAVGQSARWTLTVAKAGTTPPVVTPPVTPPVVVPPVTPPVTPPSHSGYGVGQRDLSAPSRYDPSKVMGVKLSAYPSYPAARDAARKAGTALLIDKDAAISLATDHGPNIPHYGIPVSGQLPKLSTSGVGNGTPALIYGVDGDIIVEGIEFIGFGCIGAIAVPTQHAYEYHSTESYGFSAACPLGADLPSSSQNGVGISIDTGKYPISLGGKAPKARFDSCKFTNCENIFRAVSDSLYVERIDLHSCTFEGTYGGIECLTTVDPDLYVSDNLWADCSGARLQPTNNSHGQHTFLKIGVEEAVHKTVRTHSMLVRYNAGANIYDGPEHTDTNSAVFADIRNVNPSGFTVFDHDDIDAALNATCSVMIERNVCYRLQGLDGNEDANAFYFKALGGIVGDNIIQECGSYDQRPKGDQDGTETSAMLSKQPQDFNGADPHAFFMYRRNIVIDPPQALIAPQTELFVMKIDGYEIPTYQIGNIVVRGAYKVAGYGGLIRNYGEFAKGLWIARNVLIDCVVANGGAHIRNHQSKGPIKVLDNLSYGSTGTLVIDAGSGATVSGNKVIGGASPSFPSYQTV